jgi:hypothetical protein
MPNWSVIADLTTNNLPNMGGSGRQSYRVSNAVNTYIPSILCKISAVDSQILPDFQTVQPTAAAANESKFAGVVQAPWNGFDNQGLLNSSYISVASQLNLRGTVYLPLQIKGIAYVWVDQSAGTTLTDGIPLTSSANTAGYAQGVAKASALPTIIGITNLPASGIGSSLTQAALAQATAVFTIAGSAWQSGDVIAITFQIPYTDLQPGTAQTFTVSTTLNATTAASATTAAAAVVASLNANPYFAVTTIHALGTPYPYFTAANAAGVITITVNNVANPFLVTGGSTNAAGVALEQWRFYTYISGMVANSLTATSTYTQAGGSSGTISSPATFSGGTGYKGKVPALIYGMY